jgi:Ni,Fe-hydrogenase III large subunit
LADAAGLAVAVARFSWHKEQVLRERSRLCGNRFGRGVVVPGGVSAPLVALDADLQHRLARVARAVFGDARALMATSSFLDRLRGTGPLTDRTARELAALGPVGRASGFHDDSRWRRPYDAYPRLHPGERSGADGCDAMARLRLRWDEVWQSFDLIRQCIELLGRRDRHGVWRRDVPVETGRAVGWAEAPQGEVLYVVEMSEGRVTRCWPRSASFHNLMLFHEVFAGDVLTDFPFIEASFGVSIAGVAL